MSTDKLFVFSLIGAFRTLWRLEWNDSISGYKRSYRKEVLVNMPLRYALGSGARYSDHSRCQKITTSCVLRKDPFLHDFLVMVNILLFVSRLVYFD